jgi:hypothetical protein
MKTKVYFLRLIIALLTLFAGLGVYWVFEYLNSPNEERDLCLTPSETVQTVYFAPKDKELEAKVIEPQVKEIPNEFDPDGEFFQEGKLTSEFKDFKHFVVTTQDWTNASEENDYQSKPIIPKGFIQTRKKHKFVKISVANWLISFETEKINGISYSFVGQYVKNPTEKENWTDLKGTLIKYKSAKKVSQIKLELLLMEDGC